jgi:hypothetical protein
VVVGEEHHDGLGARLDAVASREVQFHEDRVDVFLDGAFGQHQRLGDRFVAHPGCHVGEHLVLTSGQL